MYQMVYNPSEDHLATFSPFAYLFKRQRDREQETELASGFPFQMATVVGARPIWSQEDSNSTLGYHMVGSSSTKSVICYLPQSSLAGGLNQGQELGTEARDFNVDGSFWVLTAGLNACPGMSWCLVCPWDLKVHENVMNSLFINLGSRCT